MIGPALVAAAMLAGTPAASEPAGLHSALSRLEREGRFSGAVVVRGRHGIQFARGYGMADPFAGRRFTTDTPVDSASLAKPVTAAAVLLLARDRKLDLDSQVRRYVPEYPHAATTVRHLLSHSAGLDGDEAEQAIVGKTNAQLLAQFRGREPAFAPGSAFAYCLFCYTTLALLVERVSGQHYLSFARDRLALPAGVTIRAARLAEWSGRAIGYRHAAGGTAQRYDSWEGELFYGSGNLSISAAQLAQWGARWWSPDLASVREAATSPALIAGNPSGLTLGNWYCAPDRRRCHYLGHHEGFHHMLYWDRQRQISVAVVTNNGLSPGLQQRLQRALVAFAEKRATDARKELARPLADLPVRPSRYALAGGGERVTVHGDAGIVYVTRRGIDYRAVRIGAGIRYVPGLDVYLAGTRNGALRWLSLYEDRVGRPLD